MNIYSSLLFLHGHIANADLARQLGDAGRDATTDATDADSETAPDQGAGLASGSIRGRSAYHSRAPARCQVRFSPSSSMPAPSSPQRR